MRQMKVGVVFCVVTAALWACATPAPELAPENGESKLSDKAAKKTPASSSTAPAAAAPSGSSSSGAAAGPTGETEGPAGAGDACFSACAAKFPTGAQQADALEEKGDACACGACAAQCGQSDMCKEGGAEFKDGDACSQCVESGAGAKCYEADEASCTGECAEYLKCTDPCEGGGGAEAGDDDDNDK